MPCVGYSQFDLFLPVWTPGSYLVREYSRHLEAISVATGARIEKTRKNRWRVFLDQAQDEIRLRYSLYCHELSVRTNWVSEDFALIVGAATFIAPEHQLDRGFAVKLDLPTGWSGPWSGMPYEDGAWRAADYDELLDSPIVGGIGSEVKFNFKGRTHLFVSAGDTTFWDLPKATADLELLIAEHANFWGDLPYQSYTFLNLITSGRGALEHRNSMVTMADRLTMRSRESYLHWLELVSHEFFHVWNVKRLRPIELGPFDYENEVYTRSLWIAEGFTEYYGLLLVRRAKLCSDDEFLGGLSEIIRKVQTAPGRLRQPVAQASFDAWIKLYRPDENSINSSISYYTKGALIGWLLDARIRSATADHVSLDDAMRLAYHRHGDKTGYSTDDFLSIVEEVAGEDVRHWLTSAVEQAGELDYQPGLDHFSLRFKGSGEPAKSHVGITVKVEAGRLTVKESWQAGLSAGDEILGLNGYRVLPERWASVVERHHVGETVRLLIARDEKFREIEVTLTVDQRNDWHLERVGQPQEGGYESWVAASVSSGTLPQSCL